MQAFVIAVRVTVRTDRLTLAVPASVPRRTGAHSPVRVATSTTPDDFIKIGRSRSTCVWSSAASVKTAGLWTAVASG